MPPGVEAGVEENKLAAGIDDGGGEEELRLVCGDVRGGRDGREVLGRDIQAEDGLRIGHGAGAGQKRGDLETAQLEAVEAGGGLAQHLGRGKGGGGSGGGDRQGSGAHQGAAAGDGEGGSGHGGLPCRL